MNNERGRKERPVYGPITEVTAVGSPELEPMGISYKDYTCLPGVAHLNAEKLKSLSRVPNPTG